MSSDWPAPFQPVRAPPPPMSSGRRMKLEWFLIGGIVVGGLVGAAFIALSFLRLGPTPSATPTLVANQTPPPTVAHPTPSIAPSPTPTPDGQTPPAPMPGATASAGSPEPGGSLSPEIAAQIDAVIAQIPPIRQLEPLRPVPYAQVTREQFRTTFQELFDEEVDPILLAAQQRLFQRLDLVPADADLRQLLIDLNGAAVAAYYRPDNGTFYVIDTSQPFGAADRFYVSHEYTHALQDQHFGLEETRITDPAEGDAALAQLAVVEGDATTVMMQWAEQNLSLSELFEILLIGLSGTDQAALDRMPPILSRQLTFPYNEGMTFVTQLQREGGWAAVDQALQLPPASTEQILHPEKYRTREVPVDVALPDPVAALGAGWTQVYIDTLGELNTQVFVAGGETPPESLPGMPSGDWPHAEAAAGWGGDRIGMWEGPNNRWAIAWLTAWDTTTDADEFEARVVELTPARALPNRVTKDGARVSFVLASDQPTLDALRAVLH